MRKFSTAVKEQLQQDNISAFFLVYWSSPKAEGGSAGILRHTTFPIILQLVV